MDIIDPGHVITSEVTTLHTPGHTPGHICVMIDSQGQSGAVVGDVFHMSVQIEHPDWCAGVDLDKPTGQQSREQLLERSEREGMIIAAGHFGVDEHFGARGAQGRPALLARALGPGKAPHFSPKTGTAVGGEAYIAGLCKCHSVACS